MLVGALAGLLAAGGCATTANPLALSAAQRNAVEQAQDYLNTLTRFKAAFVQSGWSGPGAGVVWVDRPGRLRLSYYGPSGKDMMANGGLLVIYDHGNGATTTMPVAKTPLGLLLAPRIALTGTVAVTGFSETPAGLVLTLQDTANPGQGTLTVTLAKAPLALTGVTATDIHGRSLTLRLSGLDAHPLITPQLFALPGAAAN
jgi:outer membrane lipoprotein-sorting protein